MFRKLPELSPSPVAILHTPGSVLHVSPPPVGLVPIGNRPLENTWRLATCTDVGWYNNNQYLVTLNLASETIHTYAFDSQLHTFTLIQTLSNAQGLQLNYPDMLSISSDGRFIAITNTKPDFCTVNLYRIHPSSNLMEPVPYQILSYPEAIFHGIRFSPDSRHLICTTMENPGSLLIYEMQEDGVGNLQALLVQVVTNHQFPEFKPKSIDFSQDGSQLVVCYGPNGGLKTYPTYGAITIHAFDSRSGALHEEPLCELRDRPELSCPDAVLFSQDESSSFISVPSQSNDCVVFYAYDRETHQIHPEFVSLTNPNAQISFPHGISITSDNRFLAVSNYGHDTATIYTMKQGADG